MYTTWQGCKIERASSDKSLIESLAILNGSATFWVMECCDWLVKESFEDIWFTISASTRVTNLGNHNLFASAINSTQFDEVIYNENVALPIVSVGLNKIAFYKTNILWGENNTFGGVSSVYM